MERSSKDAEVFMPLVPLPDSRRFSMMVSETVGEASKA